MNDQELLKKLGETIKELREKKGWTQEELGLKIMVKQQPNRSNKKLDKPSAQNDSGFSTIDRQGINRIEKGKTNISVILLVKIAQALEVTLDDLISSHI